MTHRLLFLLLVAALALGLTACTDSLTGTADHLADADAASLNPNAELTYKVTIYNLTSGQPLSPGVIATHSNKVDLFEAGHTASEGIRLIAENGDPSTAISMAASLDGVYGAKQTTGGGIGPGGSAEITMKAAGNATHLSLAVMLVCTNDGFTGLDSVRLPRGAKAATYYVYGYDAGTEVNLETAESIVDGCPFVPADGMNTRPAESGVITHHPGISGVGDVPLSSDWDGHVAKITVERVM